MATQTLRAYNREISGQIDQGLTDEVISHCKYILQSHPKYVETYRLLGKAYLESNRYKEALDVFQRVLAVDADDCITHAGMSIIREDQDDLPGAIWHMERAFEIQPSNQAIQQELKVLYGKRDGAVPERLRLTRGALCRMYARGNQYRQAIAEIKSVLAETPDRVDLESLLVEMYDKAGMLVEAENLCVRLLKKYPFCRAANKVLAGLASSANRADYAVCQQRLVEIDPYEGKVSAQYPTAAQVPDEALVIERMQSGQPDETESEPAEIFMPLIAEESAEVVAESAVPGDEAVSEPAEISMPLISEESADGVAESALPGDEAVSEPAEISIPLTAEEPAVGVAESALPGDEAVSEPAEISMPISAGDTAPLDEPERADVSSLTGDETPPALEDTQPTPIATLEGVSEYDAGIPAWLDEIEPSLAEPEGEMLADATPPPAESLPAESESSLPLEEISQPAIQPGEEQADLRQAWISEEEAQEVPQPPFPSPFLMDVPPTDLEPSAQDEPGPVLSGLPDQQISAPPFIAEEPEPDKETPDWLLRLFEENPSPLDEFMPTVDEVESEITAEIGDETPLADAPSVPMPPHADADLPEIGGIQPADEVDKLAETNDFPGWLSALAEDQAGAADTISTSAPPEAQTPAETAREETVSLPPFILADESVATESTTPMEVQFDGEPALQEINPDLTAAISELEFEIPEWLKEISGDDNAESTAGAGDSGPVDTPPSAVDPSDAMPAADETDQPQSTPEWLQEMDSPTVTPASMIPDWLNEIDIPESISAEVIAQDDSGQEIEPPAEAPGVELDLTTDLHLQQYAQFIESRVNLEQVVHDLSNASAAHPEEPKIWRLLGDALTASGDLAGAQDAYAKAENLLK